MATFRGIPARSMLRMAERRRSWKCRPGSPAFFACFRPAFDVAAERLALPMEHQVATGNEALRLPLQPLDHVAVDRNGARLLRFRVLALNPNLSASKVHEVPSEFS